MTAAGVLEVENRIAQIQSRFGGRPSATADSQASTNAGSFASALSSALDASTGASATNASGNDVVEQARKYLGVPYVYGSEDPAKGLDCSSLIQLVYKNLGIDLPRVAADQATQGTAVPSLAQAKPGDLVAFNKPVDHIGIYIGDNKMIVAPKAGDVVKIQNVYETPSAIRRIIPDATNSFGVDVASLSARSSATTFGSLSSQYNSLFTAAGQKHGISPTLLAAVAKQESGFNAGARSSAGALGLMQIMPTTAKGLGVNPLNPAEAVDGAAKMLSGLVKKFGSTSLALAAYNAGPGAVQKYNGIPPYKETQNYVNKVLALVKQGASS